MYWGNIDSCVKQRLHVVRATRTLNRCSCFHKAWCLACFEEVWQQVRPLLMLCVEILQVVTAPAWNAFLRAQAHSLHVRFLETTHGDSWGYRLEGSCCLHLRLQLGVKSAGYVGWTLFFYADLELAMVQLVLPSDCPCGGVTVWGRSLCLRSQDSRRWCLSASLSFLHGWKLCESGSHADTNVDYLSMLSWKDKRSAITWWSRVVSVALTHFTFHLLFFCLQFVFFYLYNDK